MTSKAVFGDDAVTHPITGMMLENGKGAGTEAQQVEAHLGYIEKTEGKKVADAMRARVKAYNAAEAADVDDPSARHQAEQEALAGAHAAEDAALAAKQKAELEAIEARKAEEEAREKAAAEANAAADKAAIANKPAEKKEPAPEPTPEPLPPSAFTVPAEKPVEIK
jgi:hypothetical protein